MKTFFQVFQELKGNKDLETLFMTTEISRITLSRDRTKMKIYLHSDHLLKKNELHAMEELIQKQVFSGKKIQIEIHESFHLSSQYNAKILFERYEDSLLDELKEKNIVLHQMFTKGKLEWEDESTLALLLPEIALFQKEEEECIRVVEKIVHERCGIILHFSIGYSPELNKAEEKEFEEDERREYREEKEKFESIGGEKQAENADRHSDDKSEAGGKTAVNKERPEKSLGKTKEEGKEESKGERKEEGKSKDGKQEIKEQKEFKEKKDFKEKNNDSTFKRSFGSRGPFKRSDKEEVYYGRDFQDEIVPISSVGEFSGTVALQGIILHVDERPTRKSGMVIFTFSFTDDTDSIASKIFVEEENLDNARSFLQVGKTITVKGNIEYDQYDKELELSLWNSVCRLLPLPTMA